MTLETPKPMKCSAHKTSGDPCKAYAIKGGTVCRVHGGSAPQVKAKAAERWRARLGEMVDPALDRLEALSEGAQTEAVKLRANDSILDRAGVKIDDDTVPAGVRIIIEYPE